MSPGWQVRCSLCCAWTACKSPSFPAHKTRDSSGRFSIRALFSTLVFVCRSFFCHSFLLVAIFLSLLSTLHCLCWGYYIAYYWSQSAFSFKVLSCHPSPIICFHPLKLPYNGNHAMRTKAGAKREKRQAAAAAVGLSLSCGVLPGVPYTSGWRWALLSCFCFPWWHSFAPRHRYWIRAHSDHFSVKASR